MNRSTGALALLMGGALFAQEIHLKTRDLQPVSAADANGIALAPNSASVGFPANTDISARHRIIQFDHSPGVEDLDALLRNGLQVVGAQPDNAVVVAAPGGLVPALTGVRWVGAMETADKISPQLGVNGPDDGSLIQALVEFHADVTPAQQDMAANAEALTLQRPPVLRPIHAIVSGTASDLRALAARDEVAYIFPADPGLLTDTNLMPCAGMITTAGPVGQYANIVHGWDLDADHAAHLGYIFGSITPKVPSATVEAEVIRALTEWSRNTNVIFQVAASASAPRTVLIKFVSGAHGDPYPFDGPGGILAHTFYPVPINAESIAGDMHLDADENWHAGGDVDIYSVALHEAGHAIGLGHSDKPGDVMYPYYRHGMALSANDIGAAQSLYGALNAAAPVSSPVSTTSTPAIPAALPPVIPASALRLTMDSAPSSAQNASLAVTGTVSGGVPPYSVQWQTDHGYSGQATLQNSTLATRAWTASGISLVNGTNTISVTAFDASRQTATQTTAVAFTAVPVVPATHIPLTISITSPSSTVSTVSAATLTVAGTASGGTGVSRITWQTAAGASGTASGTAHWSAPGIPLLVGTNTVIVKAWDASGANNWAAVVAVRH